MLSARFFSIGLPVCGICIRMPNISLFAMCGIRITYIRINFKWGCVSLRKRMTEKKSFWYCSIILTVVGSCISYTKYYCDPDLTHIFKLKRKTKQISRIIKCYNVNIYNCVLTIKFHFIYIFIFLNLNQLNFVHFAVYCVLICEKFINNPK